MPLPAVLLLFLSIFGLGPCTLFFFRLCHFSIRTVQAGIAPSIQLTTPSRACRHCPSFTPIVRERFL
ncbi:hypothetical protein EJ04DRAFT_512538 [Polyplosphaeria fusca]|uniref:Uncharacterized protein n=1 Tax=Polyplosphaeria fusca TaxID=682080 RepID=A0A9P4V2M9_9PLEO|nr:hypothetical protein EJ04DRAFT_512538 [Polyplosphaeria fusca]